MAEVLRVFRGVPFTDSLKNYSVLQNVSICLFLSFLDISDIARFVENNFYSDKDWHTSTFGGGEPDL